MYSLLNKKIIYLLVVIITFLAAKTNIHAQNFTWKKVSAGGEFSVALRSDGTLWSWGGNLNGQLGVIVADHQYSPIQIGKDTDWVDVDAGGFHVLAVKRNGTLWGWGNNQVGQIGNGIISNSVDTPIQIGTDTDWKTINAGFLASFAIKQDGTIWGWGYNKFGQAGSFTSNEEILIPTQIGKDNNWEKVKSGGAHTLALKNDGTLWGWGYNKNGQLGNSVIDTTSIPIQVGTEKKWKDIDAGYEFSVALKNNGSLWSWGFNGNGQLGQGNTDQYKIPTQIGNDTNWSKIASGSSFAFAITLDSALFGWGYNRMGQLGNGNLLEQNNPVRIGIENNWDEIAAATGISSGQSVFGMHTLALKTEKETICASGANYVGQLGINSTTNVREFDCSVTIRTSSVEKLNSIIKEFIIYPNPSTGIVYIRMNNVTSKNYDQNVLIRIRNINGQLLYTEALKPGLANCKLEMQNYPKGVYFLEVINNKSNYTEKLILY